MFVSYSSNLSSIPPSSPVRRSSNGKKCFFVSTNKRILSGHIHGSFQRIGVSVYGRVRGRFRTDSINFNAGRRAPPHHYSYRADNARPDTHDLISRQRRNTRVSQKRICASHCRFCVFDYHHDTRSLFFFTTKSPFKRSDSDDAPLQWRNEEFCVGRGTNLQKKLIKISTLNISFTYTTSKIIVYAQVYMYFFYIINY